MTMKIYTTEEFKCPKCDGTGLFKTIRNDKEMEFVCPKCEHGEATNSFQDYQKIMRLSRNLFLKSAEIAKVANDYYSDLQNQFEDLDYSICSSGIIDEETWESFVSSDPECQELWNMFEEFGKMKDSFRKILLKCSSNEDF